MTAAVVDSGAQSTTVWENSRCPTPHKVNSQMGPGKSDWDNNSTNCYSEGNQACSGSLLIKAFYFANYVYLFLID